MPSSFSHTTKRLPLFKLLKQKNIIMKKVLLFAVIAILSLTSYAQNFVSDNYQNYLDAENSTVVQVHGVTFQLAADFLEEADNENTDEIRETLRTIKSFQLVAMPDLANPQSEYSGGLSKLNDNFDELVNVKDQESRFSVHIDEEDGIVYELVGLGSESDEGKFLAFSLTGEIPLEMIGEIMNKVESKGGKDLMNILDDKEIEISSINVYPNPTSANNRLTVEIPDNLIGGEGLFVDLNGKVITKFEIQNQIQELKTDGLSPGYYVVSLSKDGTTVKRKVNVIR